mmetsp:Transcript_23901/g.39524  ORF Transcript_23901/g.39524 Transcript_23901/m.39524 type:complete len:116 (-) Transcript_23901:727-1074(-)
MKSSQRFRYCGNTATARNAAVFQREPPRLSEDNCIGVAKLIAKPTHSYAVDATLAARAQHYMLQRIYNHRERTLGYHKFGGPLNGEFSSLPVLSGCEEQCIARAGCLKGMKQSVR